MAVKRSGRVRAKRDNHVPAGERPAQRRRTRKAIVEATVALLARGHTPSVEEVAAAADVSRRTVYLYFPTFDQLLIDATVGALSQATVDHALDAGPEEDVEKRLERLVRSLQHVTPQVEQLGRTLVRLTVERGADSDGGNSPRRGYRRVEWIESALAPLRGRVDARRFRRLVSALAMVLGWEAIIVQRDVCGLTPAEGEALSRWAAKALLDATLAETRR